MDLKQGCSYRVALRDMLLQDSRSLLPWRETAMCSKKGAAVVPPQALLTDGK